MLSGEAAVYDGIRKETKARKLKYQKPEIAAARKALEACFASLDELHPGKKINGSLLLVQTAVSRFTLISYQAISNTG